MEENKLPHSIMGAVITWILTLVAWLAAHAGLICAGLAAIASFYSIRASRETIALRKKQQRALDMPRVTPPDTKEPENDL
jgi:hypothetical protein